MNISNIYQHFPQCAAVISDIEAIDYFFANELTHRLMTNESDMSPTASLFHILLALSKSVREGNTCLAINKIADHCFGYHADKDGVITHNGFVFNSMQNITSLLNSLNISPQDNAPIVWDNGHLYMRRYYAHEQQLVDHFKKRMQLIPLPIAQEQDIVRAKITIILQSLFPEKFPEQFAEPPSDPIIDYQLLAVANALNKNLSVIAGGPGTGKTYTVTKLLAALVMQADNPLKIKLVAPTGKAAQRLSESISQAIAGFKGLIADDVLAEIPQQAQTIHRLLGVIPNTHHYRFNQNNKLECDVLIIDEVSMVDLSLMTRLFDALPENCNVIMLGDADQLPSVALGAVLNDIAIRPHVGYSKSNANYLQQVTGLNKIPVTKNHAADHLVILQKSRRFDGEGAIGKLAKWVISSNANDSWLFLKSHVITSDVAKSKHEFLKAVTEKDTYLLSANKHEITAKRADSAYPWLSYFIEQYYRPLLTETDLTQAFSLLAKFRILCAMRVGEQGIDYINNFVIELLGKGHLSHRSNSKPTLYHGLPIMISDNNYQLQLYNGDVGLIWQNEQGHLSAVFEDNNSETGYRSIIPSRLPSYDYVYAMTIHKTQGSEFSHVLMILPEQSDNRMMSRELIYTGLTRAKQQLGIVSNQKAWLTGVETQVKRDSGLYQKLIN